VQEYGLPCLSSGDFALQFLERDGELTSLLLDLIYCLNADEILFE
jgi:hypothetical protein